jgi:ketosteroid isomerase-like protein
LFGARDRQVHERCRNRLRWKDVKMTRKSMTGLGASILVAWTVLVAPVASAQSNPSVDQIHKELRALKDRAVNAVNTRNRDALLGEMAPNVTFTGMDNSVVSGLENLRAFYDKTFGSESSVIREMTLKVEPDALSQLHADNRIAVAAGKADAHFKLRGGREFDWPLRWTATLARNNDKWSIVALHFSGNAIDNPLMAEITRFNRWLAVAAGIIGLVIGLLIAWIRRRRAPA